MAQSTISMPSTQGVSLSTMFLRKQQPQATDDCHDGKNSEDDWSGISHLIVRCIHLEDNKVPETFVIIFAHIILPLRDSTTIAVWVGLVDR